MQSVAPHPVQPGGSTSTDRFHGLDWLRAIAALLVVALHAGIAYTLSPFPGLAWPTHDAHPSALVDAFTWWINGWIMPAFFIMGGFVAAPLLDRLGPAGFVHHRARRLLLPFLFGCLVILPLDFYIWLLGWVIDDRIPLKKLRSLKLGPQGEGLWGVAHLWFLQYLFLFCALAALLAASTKSNMRRRIAAAASSPASGFTVPLLFAIPGALALFCEPRIVIGFRHSWYPLAANLLYYAPCFAAGWWLSRRARHGIDVTLHGRLHLGLSLLVFAALLPLLRQHVAAESTGFSLLLLTSLFSASAWLTAWGAVCLSLGPCRTSPRVVQYLAGASFWIYLIHHPAVGLAQVALMRVPLPAAAKFGIVFSAATALSLLTYEACVRRTWLGALLNGPSAAAPRAAPPAVPSDVRRAA
jgi:peptidoglycan/LPS O-acetylase OafA/YrhL